MKRLNMVLSELESATHEKAAIGLRVADQERQAEELKKKLEEAASLKQAVNRNLQEELRYERELNEKMRDELGRFENEKDQIMSRLKDAEALTVEIQRETNAIRSNLQKKTDELKRLEREHEGNLERLRDLTSQLDGLRGQEAHGKGEKRRLEDELAEITREKENLLRRMNDLSTRYDEYVSQMDLERAEIVQANRNHIKLLTTKLFYQTFTEMIQKRRKDAFQAMQSCSQQLKKVESIVQRFVRVLDEHHTESKRRYLKLWYRNSMNFTHENYKKLNLIDFNIAKKRKIKFYFNWRALFLQRQKDAESKMHSVSRLSKIVSARQDLILRNKLCRWRDFVELRSYQGDALLSVVTRYSQREKRSAYVKWLALVKAEQISSRQENLAQMITQLTFKQRVFLSLKHACLQSKTERTTQKFNQWKERCLDARDRKYFEMKKLMVDRLQGVRTERLIKQVFDAIRFCNVLDKYEATKDKLGEEIPIRQELEIKRDQLVKSHRQKDKYNLFRKCCIRYADARYRAIKVWQENVSYFKRTMNRMKLRLIELNRQNLQIAFTKWREGSDRLHMVQLLGVTEDLLNENQELKNTLQDCYNEQDKLLMSKQRQQALKVERLRNIINRNMCRRLLQGWALNNFLIQSLENGLWKATKTMERRRLKNAFEKYKLQIKEVKREEYILGRVAWFNVARARKMQDNVYDAWVGAIKRFKSAKVFLIRSIKGVDRLIANDAFTTWKSVYFTSRRDVFHENIQELDRRQKYHEMQISDLHRQLQINDSTRMHLESKLQTQSHKILANFVARFIHSSQARGFYTWVDALKQFKERKRFLKSTLQYWIKQNSGRAFRTWAERVLVMKERELSEELSRKEFERKELQRIKDDEDRDQTDELNRLHGELEHSIQVKEQLKANYDKALATHVSRVRNNVYVDRRRNIFCIWADYIKKEKNAVNLIGAIARRNLRMEVFSRIRLVARENYLEANAEKVCTQLFSLLKSGLLQRAFSKWRVKTYTETVRTMEASKVNLEETKLRHAHEWQMMESRKQAKAFKLLRQKKQREVSNAWIAIAKQQKELRIKTETLQQNLDFIRAKSAAQKWLQRVKLTQYLRLKQDKALQNLRKRTLTDCYRQWHLRAQLTKTLFTKAFKFGRRIQCLNLAEGFSHIIHFSKSFKERDRERREHGVQSSVKILQRMLKKRLCETFQDLRVRGIKKQFKCEYVARMAKHVLYTRMRHFFGKWRHNAEKTKLAETVNTEGDVVLERNEMRRNVKALKDFMRTQGYSDQDINDFVSNKSEHQKQQMHRAIVGLFFRNSDFEIIPKALNQWKKWVQQRKLVKQWSRYCVNAMNHPLHWAFRRWKHSEDDARQRLKRVLKKDLIKKIIDDEMAIGSAQYRLERMDETIENLGIQRDSLLQHYIAGQRLALALGRNNHTRTLFRAFIRWKRETRDQEQHLLLQQLERTNMMISDLMSHVARLEGIHTNLVTENEELRQAAMDGIEIAKAVQDLTRERETLSQDLQDRASTIKRLIEDNNTLAFRLQVAQKEAEQLEELNKEVSGNGNGSACRQRSSSNNGGEYRYNHQHY